MKKFIKNLGLILLVAITLSGCGTTAKAENESLDSKEAIISEIRDGFEKDSIQVAAASHDILDFKKNLLEYSQLNADGLMAICINPTPLNLENTEVQRWFKDAFERTALTAEQEVLIAKLCEPAYSYALLSKSDLTGDGLVAVCENPGNINLDNSNIKKLFEDAFERTTLTTEQEVQIASLGKSTYSYALLSKSDLTSDGFVTVCENPGPLNLENSNIQKWFTDARKRVSLTEKQTKRIANSKVKKLLF